jgi:hypothetical protein
VKLAFGAARKPGSALRAQVVVRSLSFAGEPQRSIRLAGWWPSTLRACRTPPPTRGRINTPKACHSLLSTGRSCDRRSRLGSGLLSVHPKSRLQSAEIGAPKNGSKSAVWEIRTKSVESGALETNQAERELCLSEDLSAVRCFSHESPPTIAIAPAPMDRAQSSQDSGLPRPSSFILRNHSSGLR